MLKRTLIGLIVISVALTTASGVSASGVCLFKIGGTCLFWSGGVGAELNAVGVHPGDELGFYIEPHPTKYPGGDPTKIEVIVFCQNNGGNVAKGVNPGEISGDLSAFKIVGKEDIIKNGKVTDFMVHWTPDEDVLNAVDYVCENSLNPNWSAYDVVPTAWSGDVALEDEDGTIATKRLCHVLPHPELLDWDQKAQAPTKQFYDTEECP